MRLRSIEQYKQGLFLSKRQQQILAGSLLGDAHLESYYRPEIARLKIEHSYSQKEYVDWLYDEFKNWTRTPPKQRLKKGFGKIYRSYSFTTLSHAELANFRNLFYSNGRKIVPIKFLEKNLDRIVLAVWFMDDGSIKSKQCNGRFLNTQSFSEREVKELQKLLKNKFLLDSSTRPDKNGFQIYILGKSSKRLRDLIGPYVVPSMSYKLPN